MALPWFLPVALNNMYSPWQRAGTMFTFFMSCLIFFAIPAIAMSSFLLTPRIPPLVSLEVNHVRLVKGVEDPFMNRQTNMADFNLSLEADFGKLFHWNTKQLYVYISVEYDTDKSVYSFYYKENNFYPLFS